MLAADARRRFLVELTAYVRKHHDAAADEERVSAAATCAESYGLRHERSIAVFVVATFVTGEDFHEYPPIRKILTDESRPPDERIVVLERSLMEYEWEAARAFCRRRRERDA